MQCRVGNAHAVSRKWGYLVSNASKYVLQTTNDVDDTIKLEMTGHGQVMLWRMQN